MHVGMTTPQSGRRPGVQSRFPVNLEPAPFPGLDFSMQIEKADYGQRLDLVVLTFRNNGTQPLRLHLGLDLNGKLENSHLLRLVVRREGCAPLILSRMTGQSYIGMFFDFVIPLDVRDTYSIRHPILTYGNLKSQPTPGAVCAVKARYAMIVTKMLDNRGNSEKRDVVLESNEVLIRWPERLTE